VGKFFEDADTLCKTYHLKTHPALRNPNLNQAEGAASDEVKEVSQISFNKHRVDRNSMRVLFFSLPASPNIQTLKYVVPSSS